MFLLLFPHPIALFFKFSVRVQIVILSSLFDLFWHRQVNFDAGSLPSPPLNLYIRSGVSHSETFNSDYSELHP